MPQELTRKTTHWTHLALALALAAGCSKSKPAVEEPLLAPTDGSASGSSGSSAAPAPPPVPAPVPDQDIDSGEIMSRTEGFPEVDVKQVLIGWKELSDSYGGKMDPRAQARSNAEAAKLALALAEQLRANPGDIDALIKQHSEDPGSLETTYRVTNESRFPPELRSLALRLKEKEVGIIRTAYGYHVIERMPPLPPDPLESAAILARPAGKGEVQVLHVILGWKDTPVAQRSTVDPRAMQRTKAETDKLAAEVLAKVRKGADMIKLMKELSEDPVSSVSGAPYLVDESSPYVEPFKKLALRLKLNEAGLVKTDFGWHIIKRVPPPPLDKLESREILARKQVADHAAVKHILLGWAEVHADDPRGKERTRAELEALVKKTVAALKKGAAIEPLMQELSEDPGSSASGESYIASPEAGLVKPFKNLALRLKVGEIGVVKTVFGIHILKRVPDAAPAAGPTLP